MSSRRSNIPPVNRQVQENYEVTVAVEDDPETGARVEVGSTPLRLLLDSLEKILYLETLTDINAETTSNHEVSCPVCFENYQMPRERAIPGAEHANQPNEKPLKLECGHIIGKNCLRRMMDQSCLAKRVCPLCRHKIKTSIGHIPLAHSNGKPDLVGALCCAIRLYLRINLTKPETHEALNEWVHSQFLQEETPEKQAYFAIMRTAVETWEEIGTKRMWLWIDARMSGKLPDEEF